MSDKIISPVGAAINATATITGQLLVTASRADVAAARFYNVGGTAAFCAMVSASASTGDAANAAVVASGDCCLFVGFNSTTPFAFVSGASAVFVQAVNYLK